MATILIVYGLCGSGKTAAARQICERTGWPFFEQPVGRKLGPVILQWLRNGGSCVVEEALFLFSEYRESFVSEIQQVGDIDVKWIVFENHMPRANSNVIAREKNDVGRLLALNAAWSPHYSIPAGVTPKSIIV
jgi:hypothetical protein